jgi:hypothetical protein
LGQVRGSPLTWRVICSVLLLMGLGGAGVEAAECLQAMELGEEILGD